MVSGGWNAQQLLTQLRVIGDVRLPTIGIGNQADLQLAAQVRR